MKTRTVLTTLSACAVLGGCTAAASIATSIADSQQVPEVVTYTSAQNVDALFSATVKAMSRMGAVKVSDRDSGLVQGVKGNWTITGDVAAHEDGSKIGISARYVPSRQMDFNTRPGLTQELVTNVEAILGTPLTPGE